MKEVTEWNGKPRWMWCWFDNENDKRKEYVVHILTKEEMIETDTSSPVLSTDCVFMHCAEIEEPKLERKTNYELAKWLADGASCGEFREMKVCNSMLIHSYYDYVESNSNAPCYDDILIRVNGGEWREPLVEVEE